MVSARLILFVLFLLVSSCNQKSSHFSRNILEYQLDGGQFAVVVVVDGISSHEARKIAQERAAEITRAQGDRYFTVDGEEMTQVVQLERGSSSENFSRKLILEKDLGKSSFERPLLSSGLYPAYRLVFTPYFKRPSLKAVDAYTKRAPG